MAEPSGRINHARALLAHTAHNSADAALCLIAEHGVNPFAAMADEHATANVVDLTAERARRWHRGSARIQDGGSRIAAAFTRPKLRRP